MGMMGSPFSSMGMMGNGFGNNYGMNFPNFMQNPPAMNNGLNSSMQQNTSSSQNQAANGLSSMLQNMQNLQQKAAD